MLENRCFHGPSEDWRHWTASWRLTFGSCPQIRGSLRGRARWRVKMEYTRVIALPRMATDISAPSS